MNFPTPGPQSISNHTLPKGVPLPQAKSGFGAATAGRTKWDDGIKWGELPEKTWTQLRFYGDVYILATSWIKHQKSGKKFPILSLAWDPETKHFSKPGDPILEDFDPRNSTNQDIKDITPRQHGYGHAIFRQSQQMGSPQPWAPVKLPISLILSIQRLSGMNVHIIDGQRYEADVTDPYWGADVYVLYDSQARAEQKYQVQIGPKSPLTEVEMEYINKQHNWQNLVVWPSRDEVVRALKENGYYDLIAPTGQVIAPTGQVIAPTGQVIAPTGQIIAPPGSAPTSFGMTPPPFVPAQEPQQYAPQAPAPVMPPQQYAQQGMPAPSFAQQGMPAPAPVPPQQYAPQGMPAPAQSFAPPQPFGAPTIPVAPPQAPVNAAPVSPVAPGLRPAPSSEELELDDIPFNGAAVTAASTSLDQEVTGKVYQVVGKGKGLGLGEFQSMVDAYATSSKRGPVKVCDRGELEGVSVLACYSQYRGDATCMKCPLRRYCIEG